MVLSVRISARFAWRETTQTKREGLTLSSTLTTLHRILGGRLNKGKCWSSCWSVDASSYRKMLIISWMTRYKNKVYFSRTDHHHSNIWSKQYYYNIDSYSMRKSTQFLIVVHNDKIYLFHMTLREVINQLALARHCDQWPSTSMPQFPEQSIANTPYTKA